MPSVEEIIRKLESVGGEEFEKAVAEAFVVLGFDAEEIEATQGESDVIVKALQAVKPYFIVVECNAVREGEQVSYGKLGQIRGNSVKYVTRYGKRFSSSYIMLVGRPDFSPDAKKLAYECVLLTAGDLNKLLEAHKVFLFSQDELETLFRKGGEVLLESFLYPYNRKLDLYALIYLNLVKDSTSSALERKKEWTPIQRLIGSIENTAWILKLENFSEEDILNAVRDLSNPFVKMVEINGDLVMLSGLTLDKIAKNMGRLGDIFLKRFTDFVKKIAQIRK